MTVTERIHGGVPRYLALLVAAVLGLALLPATANAAHNPNNVDPCANTQGAANQFTDKSEARDVHEPSIDCVIANNIASGTTSTTYSPTRPVTRGQMASFVARTIVAGGYNAELPAPGNDDQFTDIANNEHRDNINRLARANIVRGVGDGTRYAPGGLVSRQQMASFMVQAARFAVGDQHPVERDATDRFVDVPPTNVHKNNIEAGADVEPPLFRGTSATRFNPTADVKRDQMATFLVNLLRYIYDPAEAPARVNVTDATVRPGEPVTGSITGNVRSASVSGCGLTNQAVTDTDTNAQGIQFSITIPQSQTTDCDLTFSIVDNDGNTTTRSIRVTVQPAGTAPANTDRPDLAEAQQLRYISPTQVQNNAGFRRGANFRFVFDEAIPGACDATRFRLFNFDGVEYAGTTCDRDPDSTRAVFVNFETVDTQGRYDDITVAGNLFGAVVGSGGTSTNPDVDDRATEGDLPVGGTRQRTTTLTAGTTDAPDLRTVTVTDRNASTTTDPTRTAVDFTFEENAFVVDPAGFQLILNNGDTIQCEGPGRESTTEGGGNVAGGNGTMTITVTCSRPTSSLSTTRIAASEVARGVVQERTVSDQRQTGTTVPSATTPIPGNENPLQTEPVTTGGNVGTEPNLNSVTFRATTDTDLVQFIFDKPVQPQPGTTANAALFKVYFDSGEEVRGTVANRSPNNGESNIVFVRFGRNVEGFVGGSVEEAAVTGSEGTASGNPNSPDEEGSTPRQTTTTITGGRTEGPDLIQVRMSETRNQQGQLTGLRVVYRFDENIDNFTASSLGGFHLYGSDGRRFTCTNARIGNPDNTNPQEATDEVICTQYETTTGTTTTTTQSDTATRDAALATVRGTVEPDQVEERGSGTRQNPVGAESVTRS